MPLAVCPTFPFLGVARFMRNYFRYGALALICFVLAACASTASISGAQAGITVDLKTNTSNSVPRTDRFGDTSFGNYEFQAKADGAEPFYGLLPLRFSGGRLALDILFFAPATFFNLRTAYPFYEFDIEKKVVRYKRKESDEWRTYTPTAAEAARAEKLFAK
jgi:hypothetical protein